VCPSRSLLVSFVVTSLWATPARAEGPRESKDVCPVDDQGRRLCDLKIRTEVDGQFKVTSTPAGYGPGDLQSAYGLPANGGAGKIVAIWGAQADYPNAESDLAVYRAQYGLPPCTSQNGCLVKIDASGGTNYPPPGQDGWIFETAVDLEAVSAACPGCSILLVEGGDLGTALATVIAKGASAFSCSWTYGGGEAACQSSGYDANTGPLANSGILVAACTGDASYDPGDTYPAECTGVLAVGGTTLTPATNARGWTEAAWNGAGSQCSASVPKPSWQNDPGCSTRMTGDVSAVADGLAIYFTQSVQDGFPTGWVIGEGTSFATPFVAAALTSLGIANGNFSPSWVWQNPSYFYDVTTGNNINTSSTGNNVAACSAAPTYFCTAGVGYDGPTGWGTPNGSLLATALPPGADAGGGDDGGGQEGGSADDAGDATNGSEGGSVLQDAGAQSTDSGATDGTMTSDATTIPPPSFEGGQTPESGASFDWNWADGPLSSTGCGCATASRRPSRAYTGIGAALIVACVCRRRRHSPAICRIRSTRGLCGCSFTKARARATASACRPARSRAEARSTAASMARLPRGKSRA
jgi:hypothetical protein